MTSRVLVWSPVLWSVAVRESLGEMMSKMRWVGANLMGPDLSFESTR